MAVRCRREQTAVWFRPEIRVRGALRLPAEALAKEAPLTRALFNLHSLNLSLSAPRDLISSSSSFPLRALRGSTPSSFILLFSSSLLCDLCAFAVIFPNCILAQKTPRFGARTNPNYFHIFFRETPSSQRADAIPSNTAPPDPARQPPSRPDPNPPASHFLNRRSRCLPPYPTALIDMLMIRRWPPGPQKPYLLTNTSGIIATKPQQNSPNTHLKLTQNAPETAQNPPSQL